MTRRVLALVDLGDATDDAALHARALALLDQPTNPRPRAALEAILGRPSRRLAAYGTLRPGESNHHVVSTLRGPWQVGSILGTLRQLASGYPGLDLDPATTAVPVAVLDSEDLPGAWSRLDDFEGPGYRRALVQVTLDAGGETVAYAYLVAGAHALESS